MSSSRLVLTYSYFKWICFVFLFSYRLSSLLSLFKGPILSLSLDTFQNTLQLNSSCMPIVLRKYDFFTALMTIKCTLHNASSTVYNKIQNSSSGDGLVVHPLSIFYAVPSSVLSTILVQSMIYYFNSSSNTSNQFLTCPFYLFKIIL